MKRIFFLLVCIPFISIGQITVNDGFRINAPRAADMYWGTISAGKTVPYANTSAAVLAIPSAYRYVGKTVGITVAGETVEYWWKNGITNIDLVEKTSSGATYTFTNRIANTSGTVSIDTATNQNAYNATHASFWGDSFTGNGTYVSFFEKLTGIKAYNGGIGGETSIQIKARFDAAPIKHTQPTVIWAGRNNIGDTTQIKNDINAMVAALGHNRYLVVSILPSANDVGGSAGNLVNIAAVNTYLSNVYGTRYINAYTFLRANGDGSVNDNADIAAGFIPRSLRFAGDGLHINEKGDSLVAALMYAKKDILTPSYGVTVANTLATVQSTTDDVSTTNISSLYTGYNTGRFAITPQYSIGYGFNALKSYSSGIRMTALGSYAASNITTASDATIVGASAGQYASNLTQSTVIGSNAGLVGGEDLTAVGWYSYPSLTSGLRNTGLGGKTGFSLTTGSDNLLAGYSAGSGITTGNNNAYLGSYAGNATTTASNNVGIGFYAMVNNTTGSETVAIGTNALQSNTTGINNVSVGVNSLAFNTASSNNTAVGYGAMNNPTSGGSNTAIGNSSLKFMAGSNNIGIGSNAGAYAISGSNQIFLNSIDRGTATGDSTLSILYGYQSATIANQKLRVNGFLQINDATQGAGKVFTSDANGVGSWQTPSGGGGGADSTIYGYNGTLRDNRTMNGNRKDLYLGSGVDSMSNLHSASINTNHGFSINDGDGGTIATTGKNWALTAIGHVQFSGVDSLSFNGAKIRFNNKIFMPAVRTPWDTLATLNDVRISAGIGWGLTGNSGTTAGTNFIGTTDNVPLVFKVNGLESGRIGISGNNTSFGYTSNFYNNTGTDNAAFGKGAMQGTSPAATTGSRNAAFGSSAMANHLTGNDNTAIGYGALLNVTTGNSNIAIGANAGGYLAGLSNRVILNSIDRGSGTNDSTLSILYGFQAATIADQKLRVNGKFQINDGTQGTGKVLTSDANGVASWQTPSGGGSGTVNSGTQYRLAHYATTGTAISEAAAITGDRLLISDANGVPTHSAVTATEAGYLTGISSSVQTQLTARLLISDTATMLANANVLHKTGTETVYGAKTFISNITATGGVALGAGSLTLTNGTIMNYPSWTALSIYGYTTGSGVWIGSTQSNQGFANISSTGLQYGFSSVVNGTFGNNAVYIGGTGSANASALLHLNSTTKGFLPPVMTRTQADAIASKAFGLKVITSNDSSELVWMGKWMYVAKSGYYTPTLTNTANIDASTAYACVYSVSGDVVTVSGTVDIDPSTASTATELRMSLPITTTFTNTLQGNGTASPTAIQASWGIESVNGASTVAFKCSANDISNNTYKFTFTYKLQ